MNYKKYHIVSVEDLWKVFRAKWRAILLITILITGSFWGVIRLSFTPNYSSTATLYILRKEDVSYSYSSSDFTMALNVVNDCTYLLKSHAVLDEVSDELKLDMPYKELYEAISTKNPSNTRILEVTVETTSVEQSKKIVDSVCRVGVEKINKAMGFNQVNFYEYGTTSSIPSNRTGIKTYLIVAIITAVLAYFACLIAEQLDDSLNTKEEIETALGVSVIGEIPNFNESSRKGYGYKYKRYEYGYGREAKKAKSVRKKGK